MIASMEEHCGAVVLHDGLGPELRQALFARAMPEFFALPLAAKEWNVDSAGPLTGYFRQRPGSMALVSVRIAEATDAGCVRDFANLLWPQGNPAVCTIAAFANNILKVEQTVERMVLESLGVQKEHVDSHLDSLVYSVRLSHYGVPPDLETSISAQPHRDISMTTLIVQHEVGGLEVQSKDGRWLAVPPDPDTFTIMAGEHLTVVTNGRVMPCLHRVRTPSNRERFSVPLFCNPREAAVVRTLDELVDEDHPLLYNLCNVDEYTKFRFSEEGRKFEDTLKAFCGVDKDKPMA